MNKTLKKIKISVSKAKNNLKNKIRQKKHSKKLPDLPKKYISILDELRLNGAVVTSLNQLMVPNTENAIKGLDRLFQLIGKLKPTEGDYALHASTQMIQEERDVILWGLDPGLLALVENYIQLPIAYRGLTVRQDLADGKVAGTRMWHRDDEDISIIKIIVYLNDVGLETGPFEYIPSNLNPSDWRVQMVESSRVLDEEMGRLVPIDYWQKCTGPRGTVVLVDTCRVYHRGMAPIKNHRCAAFFCYNSTIPKNPIWCESLFDRKKFLDSSNLTKIQSDAINYNY